MATVSTVPAEGSGVSKPAKRRRRRARGVYTIEAIRMVEVSPGTWRELGLREPVRGRSHYDTYEITGTTKLGERIRERSLNRAELVGLKNRLEIKDANAPDDRPVTSHLSDERIRQAEAAFLRLAEIAQKRGREKPYSLDLAIQHFDDSYYEPTTNETIAQLMPVFLERLAKELHRSPAYLRSIQNDLERLCAYPGEPPRFSARKKYTELPLAPNAFGRLKPHEFLTIQHAYPFMRSLKWIPDGSSEGTKPVAVGNTRWNKARGNFHSFFGWMAAPPQCYIKTNPFTGVETRPETKKPIVRLYARQAAELMRDVMNYRDGAMVPYFTLLLFAGIRPSEKNSEIERLSKHPRLFQLVNLPLGIIDVTDEIAKGKFIRIVRLQPNVKEWLKDFPLRKFPIFPKNARAMIDVIRKRNKLAHDVLRHTFISFHSGKFRSVGDAAMNAGNSEAVTRKRYLNPPTEEEAELFWKITPELLRSDVDFYNWRIAAENLENLHADAEDALELQPMVKLEEI